MRRFAAVLVLALLLGLSASRVVAQSLEAEDPTADQTADNGNTHSDWITVAFDLSAGYRTDKLNWHIAGNIQGSNPNVLSELTWSDLTIYQLKLANRTVVRDRIYLRGHLDVGVVTSGDNRDSDYQGDDRTGEFSRSLNSVDGNHAWDGSLAIGPRFTFFGSSLDVCPLLGYAVSRQDLNIVDGFQAITPSPATLPIGPFPGLDSRYETRWKGPWLGMDLLFSAPCTAGPFTAIGVIFTAEYHWVDFNAEANWNLRPDFQHPVSFTQEAEGTGLVAGAKILFEADKRWGINMGMNVREMTTDAGLDRVYFADGTTADTRLNEVRWRSFTFEAGVSYQF
jgi:hypothetical protein